MRDEITLSTQPNNIEVMTDFARDLLSKINCPRDVISEISIVIDEIFSNIVRNGYPDGHAGSCTFTVDLPENEKSLYLTFSDDGIPFDPTKKEDPDIDFDDLPPIGGFGIFLVKQMTNQVSYERANDKNILTIRKDF